MKIFILLFILSSQLSAGIDSLQYKIAPGKYHLGGKLEAVVSKIDTAKNVMEVKINYDIIKRPMIPAPANLLKSSMLLQLPLDFQDERGYLNLELDKKKELDKVIVYHAGRVSFGKMTNAHHVRIIGKNSKYVCDVYYHPSIPELGWSKLGLLLNITLLSNYQMDAELQ
jgi:hypothetical protein